MEDNIKVGIKNIVRAVNRLVNTDWKIRYFNPGATKPYLFSRMSRPALASTR
jgi:hypothetical protein